MVVPYGLLVHTIKPTDVLMGRGKTVHQHVGNMEYRRIVKARRNQYMKLPQERDAIATEVINAIESRGGRFIQPLSKHEGSREERTWVLCADSVVRTKVKQALRDMAKHYHQDTDCSSRVTTKHSSNQDARHQKSLVKAPRRQSICISSELSGGGGDCRRKSSERPKEGGKVIDRQVCRSQKDTGSSSKAKLVVSADQQLQSMYGNLVVDTGTPAVKTRDKSWCIPRHIVANRNHRDRACRWGNVVHPLAPMTTSELLRQYLKQETRPNNGWVSSRLTAAEMEELVTELQKSTDQQQAISSRF